MKRYLIIFLFFLFGLFLYAEKADSRIEGKTYNWESGSTEFVNDSGRDNRSVPNLIDYQGKITDDNGNPLTSSVSITFTIYDDATGGSNLWDETHASVTPADGLVHVLLGSQFSFGSSLFNGSDLWLGINVNSDGEMTPRLRIVSVPYAIYSNNSGNLDGLDSTDFMPVTTDNWINTTGDTMTGQLTVLNNVGIGTASPVQRLDVVGDVEIGGGSSGFIGTGEFLKIRGQSADWILGIQNETISAYTDFFIGTSAEDGKFHIEKGGNVGIGTNAPSHKLTVMGRVYAGDDLEVAGDADIDGNVRLGWIYGPEHKLTIHSTSDNNTLRLAGPNGPNLYGARLDFGIGDNCYIDEEYDNQLTLYSSVFTNIKGGNVMIGDSAPPEKLSVDGDVYVTGTLGVGTFNSSRGKVDIHGSLNYNTGVWFGYLDASGWTATATGTGDYSLYASHRIAASQFNAFSDSRIKNIQGISDSKKDLKTMMDIEIIDYTMIDTVTKGNKNSKKVIGQQVKEVYPQAISISTDVVPDIYQRAEITGGWVALSTDIAIGDRIKIINEDKEEIYEVLEVNDSGFRVNLLEDGRVFVYGHEVDDFHSVDYEAIAMLNVSATQELANQVIILQAENSELKAKMAHIESILQNLEIMNMELTDASK